MKNDSLIADKPEIEQEETFIHTGEGDQTEVICIVHSSPKAEITWYKDSEPLTRESADYLINQRGNRHTLTIPGVDSSKFGKYTCRAQNQYGEDQKTTEVSGKKKFTFFFLVDSILFHTKYNVYNLETPSYLFFAHK